MTFALIAGLLAGLIAAAALTFAYHRLKGNTSFLVALATITLSMFPRVYFSLGQYAHSVADDLYISGWMIVVIVGFVFVGCPYGRKFFKGKQS